MSDIVIYPCRCGHSKGDHQIRIGRTGNYTPCNHNGCRCDGFRKACPNAEHPLRSVWSSMRKRCNNPNDQYYKSYGGRGITVCAQWATFDVFVEDAGPRPSVRHTLDRIDNDGNYEPGNVRWVTEAEQHSNTSRCRYHVVGGVRMTTKQVWAHYGKSVRYKTLTERLRRGWPLERALTSTPPQGAK